QVQPEHRALTTFRRPGYPALTGSRGTRTSNPDRVSTQRAGRRTRPIPYPARMSESPTSSLLPRIRRAGPDEADALAPLLTERCRRPKAHGGYDPALLARWATDLRITPEDIRRDAVLVAELAVDGHERLAGFARVARASGPPSSPARLPD